MRIVHLSDIHLSINNFDEFKNHYKDALINDLKDYHNQEKRIDIIAITGDLIDKGGHSLKDLPEFIKGESPFTFFEKKFINPIKDELGLTSSNFLFVPGNHDIDESKILWIDEKEMKKKINRKSVNRKLEANRDVFTLENERIRQFKEFERKFHEENHEHYFPSNNESIFIYEYKPNINVGFILVNDSWRCSTCNLNDDDLNKHYFGVNQLHDGLSNLKKTPTRMNICLFHHGLEVYEERDDIERFFSDKEISFFLYGHHHNLGSSLTKSVVYQKSSIIGFRGRAALDKPDEEKLKFQPGYQIFDIDVENGIIPRIHYRRYNYEKKPGFVDDSGYWAKKAGIDDNGYKIKLNGNLTASGSVTNLDNLDETMFKNL